MPITTPEIKIKDVKRFGAKIIQHGDDVNTALQEAKSISKKKKLTLSTPLMILIQLLVKELLVKKFLRTIIIMMLYLFQLEAGEF